MLGELSEELEQGHGEAGLSDKACAHHDVPQKSSHGGEWSEQKQGLGEAGLSENMSIHHDPHTHVERCKRVV